MKWLKAHWKAPAVVLILLLAWGGWYTRPVSVYGLIPGVKRADSISLYSRPLGPYRSGGSSSIRDLRPEDPKWDAALRALEAPAFAVPPLEPAPLPIPAEASPSGQTPPGRPGTLWPKHSSPLLEQS